MLTLTLLFSFTTLIYYLLWALMLVSMLVLIAVILLQEGKGGGLAEAFGGAGAETFGVKAHGINKFTAIVGGLFLLLCIVLNKFHVTVESEKLLPGYQPPPQDQSQGDRPDPAELQRMIQEMQNQQGGGDGGPPPGGAPPAGNSPPAGGGNTQPEGGGPPPGGGGN
jgi:preprotein translocase subunit SecG